MKPRIKRVQHLGMWFWAVIHNPARPPTTLYPHFSVLLEYNRRPRPKQTT